MAVIFYDLRSDESGDFIGECSDGEYVSKDDFEAAVAALRDAMAGDFSKAREVIAKVDL